jgi:hypothetical protein
MFILQFIIYFLPVVSEMYFYIYATIRNNNLYYFYQEREFKYIKSNVYELKEGSIINTINTAKTYEYIDTLNKYRTDFIDGPSNSQKSINKIWVGSEVERNVTLYGNSTHINWMGYIKLDDMSLKRDSSFIKIPTHKNFPTVGYTINTINNELGSAIYIIGGRIKSKYSGRHSIVNTFFKYNFTSKKWIDMTYSTNRKLDPIEGHQSVVVYNRYLVVLGGRMDNKNISDRLSNKEPLSIYNSLYDLPVFDTFTSSWEIIKIKPNVFDTSVTTIQFSNFLASVYNNKIIVLGGFVGENGSNKGSGNHYFGVLDYESKTWNWAPIQNEDSNKYYSTAFVKKLLVYEDQLIICTGNLKSIFIYYC